ncbi:MAG: anthrone oxygenase family protein [Aeromicrobium sp.]
MTSTFLVAGTMLTGLSAGLFVAFSIAVMPGLRRAGDAAFVETMRGINAAILNPVFAVVLVGPFVLTTVAVVLGRHDGSRGWVLAGIVLYVLGAFVVTGAVNIPLNDALGSGTGRAGTLRAAFEDRWTRWNHLRSALTTAAFTCLVVGVLER